MDRNMKLGFHLCNESHFQEDGNGKSESMGRKPHIRLVAYKVPNKFPKVTTHQARVTPGSLLAANF